MITAFRVDGDNSLSTFSFKGLSTDTKPTDKWSGIEIKNGSSFMEINTHKIFFFDADSRTWK